MAGEVRAAMEDSDEVPNDPLLDAGVLRALNVKLDGKLVSEGAGGETLDSRDGGGLGGGYSAWGGLPNYRGGDEGNVGLQTRSQVLCLCLSVTWGVFGEQQEEVYESVPACPFLPVPSCLCLQLDARNFSAFEWPRIREGIAVQTYEVLQER